MRIIVVGCGRVGSQLGILLSYEGHDVAIIDNNRESFGRLGDTFNGLTIEGLGFDEDVLKEAGIEETDVLAAVTDKDNSNLMIAEVASKIYSVPHVVARLYNPERERTFQQLGLDYVCGTTLVAESLLDRIMEGRTHAIGVVGDVEIVEFIGGQPIDGKTVNQIQVPGEFRIASITRGKTQIIPKSDTVLKRADLIVAAVKGTAHARVDKLKEEVRG